MLHILIIFNWKLKSKVNNSLEIRSVLKRLLLKNVFRLIRSDSVRKAQGERKGEF